MTFYCDNRGVLNHGNVPTSSLCEKQAQADLLRYLKQLVRENPFQSSFEWVEGHAVERKGWAACDLTERLNDKADRLAKKALLAGYASDEYIHPDLPFEQVRIKTGGTKVTGSIQKAVDKHYGHKIAQQFYDAQHIISSPDFNLVWWDGVELALLEYPKMFRVWLTKHVSEFAGTNAQLSYWREDVDDPTCQCCGEAIETTMHLTRCQSPGRRKMLALTVRTLTSWMVDTGVDVVLVDMIEEYLLAQGEKTMTECLRLGNADYELLAECSDRLRWDSLLEGRISSLWIQIMKPVLLDSRLYLSPRKWGIQFIEHLLNITHKQWIFRNSRVHYKGLDGLTAAQHEEIFNRVEELMYTEPDDLLPKHRHLMEQDFEGLAEGSAVERQYWIVRMESAVAAAKQVRERRDSIRGLARLTRPRRRRDQPRHRASNSVVYQRSRRRLSNDEVQQQRRQALNNENNNYPATQNTSNPTPRGNSPGSSILRRQGRPPTT